MNRQQLLSDEWLVLRRPHFRECNGQIFFMISNHPTLTLSKNEIRVWNALEEKLTIGALRNRFGEGIDAILKRFGEFKLYELAQFQWPSGRRKVLVLEPHSDDAALSVGATMWLRRHECEFTLITLGGRGNYSNYSNLNCEYFDPEEISALRAAEGRLFMDLLGGHYFALPHNSGTLRYQNGHWTLDWFKTHRDSIFTFIEHQSNQDELSEWKTAARGVLEEYPAEEVWLPMGIGMHTDHELTRNAVLDVLIEYPELVSASKVMLYQDVPYLSSWPKHGAAILDSLRRSGAVFEPEPISIDEVFERKLELISIFASQFEIGTIRSKIENSARLEANDANKKAEVLFNLIKCPNARDSFEMYADAGVIRAVGTQLQYWIRNLHRAKLVRLLLMKPVGRFREDMEILLRIFPKALIDVYVTSTYVSEVEKNPYERIKVHYVLPQAKAWVILSLKLAISPPRLTLLITGKRRAVWLSKLWPMTHAIVLPSFDHFMRGFESFRKAAQIGKSL